MPFNEITPFTVNVTAADIAASTSGRFTNSLATALNRLNAAKQLPGQENDENVQSCAVFAETQLRLNNGQLLALCDVQLCSIVYSADLETAIKIALENVSGIKPANAYTATLVHN